MLEVKVASINFKRHVVCLHTLGDTAKQIGVAAPHMRITIPRGRKTGTFQTQMRHYVMCHKGEIEGTNEGL